MKGKGKGKQVTGTFAVTATGRSLPIQLIYAGKNTRCYSQRIVFRMDFVTQSDNHWSNEELAIQHVHEVILPYVGKTKEKLVLPEEQKSLLI